jgi:hypothetical protein
MLTCAVVCQIARSRDRGQLHPRLPWQTYMRPQHSGVRILLRALGMGLTFLLDLGHHRLLRRGVRDRPTVDALIAARLSRVWHAARVRRHLVENVKLRTITLETLQEESSVYAPQRLCL